LKRIHRDSSEVDVMMPFTRTTVTLDSDIEALLRGTMKQRGLSFKTALNSALRAGLADAKAKNAISRKKRLRLGPSGIIPGTRLWRPRTRLRMKSWAGSSR